VYDHITHSSVLAKQCAANILKYFFLAGGGRNQITVHTVYMYEAKKKHAHPTFKLKLFNSASRLKCRLHHYILYQISKGFLISMVKTATYK